MVPAGVDRADYHKFNLHPARVFDTQPLVGYNHDVQTPAQAQTQRQAAACGKL